MSYKDEIPKDLPAIESRKKTVSMDSWVLLVLAALVWPWAAQVPSHQLWFD